eukprot:gene3199-3673_t
MPASNLEETTGLVTDLEVKFQSAVNLIRSLPKQGQFQPSYEDASKVYGYYKQAQLGPCNQQKPGFWDVVGRAKWNAWSELGEMSKEEAKEYYVIEIKKLFERLTESDDFADQQKQLAGTLIPFCEATGLTIPVSLREDIKLKNRVAKKERIDNAAISNGHANGHHKSSESFRNDTIEVCINGDSININHGSNGQANHGDFVEDSHNLNGASYSSEEVSYDTTFGNDVAESVEEKSENGIANAENQVSKRHSAELSQESSFDDDEDDDDVYCDSVNPDDVSSFISFSAGANHEIEETSLSTNDATYNNLTNVTDDSSLLFKPIVIPPLHHGQNGESTNIHSTPALSAKSLEANSNVKGWQKTLNFGKNNAGAVVEKLPNKAPEYSSESIEDSQEVTDYSQSTMSSSSATDASVLKDSHPQKEKQLIEDELCREFARVTPRHHNDDGDKSDHRDMQQCSDRIEDHEVDASGNVMDNDRQLVVGARGGSSQDLAHSSSKPSSSSRLRQDEAERPTALSAGKSSQQRSRKSRRKHGKGSSSESETTSGSDSQTGRGQTIGEQIVRTLQRLEQDMQMVVLKLNSIEEGIKTANQTCQKVRLLVLMVDYLTDFASTIYIMYIPFMLKYF